MNGSVSATFRKLKFSGAMTQRGFWLYVWRIEIRGCELLYVGRTGDSSSPNAAAPLSRMGQHLGKNKRENMLRRHLEESGLCPEECKSFELLAYGPLFSEKEDMDAHKPLRDKIAALERDLQRALSEVGYKVLNKVRSRTPTDPQLWDQVRQEFTNYFPKLAHMS